MQLVSEEMGSEKMSRGVHHVYVASIGVLGFVHVT
jgi:hypothetical protein